MTDDVGQPATSSATTSRTRAVLRWIRAKVTTISFGVVVGILLLAAASLVIVFIWPQAYRSSQPQAWQAIFNLAGFVVFLGSIVAVIPVARHNIDTDDAFAAGLVATAALIPTTVTEFTTVAAYITPYVLPQYGSTPAHVSWLIWVHNLALMIGASAGIVAWLFWGMFNRRLVLVQRQNAGVYSKLRERYMELRGSYDIVRSDTSKTDETERIALCTIWRHLCLLARELALFEEVPPPAEYAAGTDSTAAGKTRKENNDSNDPRRAGLRWVLATGYIDLWDHVHDAEEELVILKPKPDLIRGALDDEQRLQGSTIPNRDQLLETLRQAAAQLGAQSDSYFHHVRGKAEAIRSMLTRQGNADAVRNAREALRYVRHEINSFRTSNARELVRRRNHLLEAVVFTRITTYGLLGLAILLPTPQNNIAAAAVFYLVGALIGLFNRLRAVPTTSASIEDYGLASATLVQITPFSGLAAVGGVLIVGLLGPALNPGQHVPLGSLGGIFNLSTDKLGIVVAAVFGLTPTLLISRLEQAAEQFRTNLRSTESHTPTEPAA